MIELKRSCLKYLCVVPMTGRGSAGSAYESEAYKSLQQTDNQNRVTRWDEPTAIPGHLPVLITH